MLAGHDDWVAPVRRALAVWSHTPDKLGVVSIHGASTQAIEKNGTAFYDDVFEINGRTWDQGTSLISVITRTGRVTLRFYFYLYIVPPKS